MEESSLSHGIEIVSDVIDVVGIAVIALGITLATFHFVGQSIKRSDSDSAYRLYRQQVGKSILLGLEFLVAADIIRTVTIAPSFRGVGVLALIVLIRTFLSFTLEVELEGRWPWQREKRSPAG